MNIDFHWRISNQIPIVMHLTSLAFDLSFSKRFMLYNYFIPTREKVSTLSDHRNVQNVQEVLRE